jgi:hypothetical protein
MNYTGYISGLDIIATPGKPIVCLAFVSKKPGGDIGEIQVRTEQHQLQTALELATEKGMKVAVTYTETTPPQKILTRVQLLDRTKKP